MAEIAVVGHDEDPVGAARSVLAADIVERIEVPALREHLENLLLERLPID